LLIPSIHSHHSWNLIHSLISSANICEGKEEEKREKKKGKSFPNFPENLHLAVDAAADVVVVTSTRNCWEREKCNYHTLTVMFCCSDAPLTCHRRRRRVLALEAHYKSQICNKNPIKAVHDVELPMDVVVVAVWGGRRAAAETNKQECVQVNGFACACAAMMLCKERETVNDSFS